MYPISAFKVSHFSHQRTANVDARVCLKRLLASQEQLLATLTVYASMPPALTAISGGFQDQII